MLKLNLGCGGFPLKGFLNFDSRGDLSNIFKERNEEFLIIDNWKFQDGLFFKENSVNAITVSHALMYLKVEEYVYVFQEIHRILKPKGVFRVTEDSCERPEEELKQDNLPWGNPASVTGLTTMANELLKVFTLVEIITPEFTNFIDNSLIQQNHGTPPRVFHIEAIK